MRQSCRSPVPAIAMAVLLTFAGSPAVAQHQHQHDAASPDIGAVAFRVSCDPAVRADFDRALALLHHMMYEESRHAFHSIADQDPTCAMAHWGIAATLFQPLWPGRPDVETRRRGWHAVERARDLGPATDRERALLAAADAFFQDPDADEWWPRIERWAVAMAAAYAAFPDDDDIAAFHGLATLAAGQVADDQLAYNARAAEVLRAVHERAPLHPGAIHYTIHADDVTGRAAHNLPVVESYGDIAPSVPHALHMPSHIYVRLGDWPEVIAWNRRSADAALDFRVGDSYSGHHIHALDYLLYAYLQKGDDARAERVLEEALATEPYEEGFTSAFHLAIMPARYVLERRAWDEAARITPDQPDYLAWERYGWPRAVSWFTRGIGAVHTGDPAAARDAEARLRALQQRATDAGERAFATYIEIDRLILSGRLARAEGDDDAAVARLRRAAELEQTVQKHPITPGALMPPYEALGDLLMELDRPADALAAYETSLGIWPGRFHSLLGAARAARDAGDAARSREHYAALLAVVGDTTSPRPGVREAAAAVGTQRQGARR